jgi:hypothetical protein
MSEPDERFPTRTIIAAAPGWYVAVFMPGCHSNADESDNWDDYLALQPIVAWEIERYQQRDHTRWHQHVSHEVMPLTTMGNMNHVPNWAIKSPDGKFDFAGDIFDNEAEVIQELKEAASNRLTKPPARETA